MVVVPPQVIGIPAGSISDLESSLRKWIYDGYAGIPIVSPDDWNVYKRPVFSLGRGQSYSEDLGSREYTEVCTFRLCYHGDSYRSTTVFADKLFGEFRRLKVLPFYLYDFRLPPPTIGFISGSGLPIGNYFVMTSARNYQGDETLPSQVILCQLNQSGTLELSGFNFPSLHPVTTQFRYWIGTGPTIDDMRYVGHIDTVAGVYRAKKSISALPVLGPVKPINKSRFFYKVVHVDSVHLEIVPWRRNTLWDAEFEIVLRVHLTREYWQSDVIRILNMSGNFYSGVIQLGA